MTNGNSMPSKSLQPETERNEVAGNWVPKRSKAGRRPPKRSMQKTLTLLVAVLQLKDPHRYISFTVDISKFCGQQKS